MRSRFATSPFNALQAAGGTTTTVPTSWCEAGAPDWLAQELLVDIVIVIGKVVCCVKLVPPSIAIRTCRSFAPEPDMSTPVSDRAAAPSALPLVWYLRSFT